MTSGSLRSKEDLIQPNISLGCEINHDNNYELFAFVGSDEEYKKLYYDRPHIKAEILYNYTPVNYNAASHQGQVHSSSNVNNNGIENSMAAETNMNLMVNGVYQRWNAMWSRGLRRTIIYNSSSNSNSSLFATAKTASLTDVQDRWINLWTTGQISIYENEQEEQQQRSIFTTALVSESYRQSSLSLFSQPNRDANVSSSSTPWNIVETNKPTKNNMILLPLFNQRNTDAIKCEEEYPGSSTLPPLSSPIKYNGEKKYSNKDKHKVEIGDNNNNVTKRLSDSTAFNAGSVAHNISSKKYAVAMISNVSRK